MVNIGLRNEGKKIRLLQSLARGLQTLDILHQYSRPLKLTEIANNLGIEKSKALHILKTLVAAGYAEQNESRRYLAAKRHIPSQSDYFVNIIKYKENCRPILENLVKQTGECAHLAVLVEYRVWYIDKIDSTIPLKVDHPIGSLAPLHCTALGKAFIAFGDAKLPHDLKKYTSSTIITLEDLRREIEKTRTQGYAIDKEEFSPGIRCVAGPIFDDNNKMIAALGISGPSVRIDDIRLKELGNLIKNVTQNIRSRNF